LANATPEIVIALLSGASTGAGVGSGVDAGSGVDEGSGVGTTGLGVTPTGVSLEELELDPPPQPAKIITSSKSDDKRFMGPPEYRKN